MHRPDAVSGGAKLSRVQTKNNKDIPHLENNKKNQVWDGVIGMK
jgi:hypothetical protein